jgi:hypothetical protein
MSPHTEEVPISAKWVRLVIWPLCGDLAAAMLCSENTINALTLTISLSDPRYWSLARRDR